MTTHDTLHLNDDNFTAEVLESDRPVLVDFWAEWCGPCRIVGPTIDELATKYAGSVKVAKLNVDENQQTAASFAVNSIPSVLLFNGGQVIETLVGVQSKARYEQALQQVLATV